MLYISFKALSVTSANRHTRQFPIHDAVLLRRFPYKSAAKINYGLREAIKLHTLAVSSVTEGHSCCCCCRSSEMRCNRCLECRL